MLALAVMLAGQAAACPVPRDHGAQRAAVLTAVNAARAGQGLAPLRAVATLDRAAQGHACDSAGRGRMGHEGSDGSDLAQRIARAGYRIGPGGAAENLGFGYPDARAVVAGWMASAEHRRNILAPRLTQAGIGLALDPSGRPHWVLVAAAPR